MHLLLDVVLTGLLVAGAESVVGMGVGSGSKEGRRERERKEGRNARELELTFVFLHFASLLVIYRTRRRVFCTLDESLTDSTRPR